MRHQWCGGGSAMLCVLVVRPRVQQFSRAHHRRCLLPGLCGSVLHDTLCHENSARRLTHTHTHTRARSTGGVPPRAKPITENLAASCRATEQLVDLLPPLCLRAALLISIANPSALCKCKMSDAPRQKKILSQLFFIQTQLLTPETSHRY